jgi:signal transduction histidine kinase
LKNQDNTENRGPHFDISAFVVKQLGDELISDEVTALMELVKNSYDADADYVNIVINTEAQLTSYELNYKDHRGYILIDDNGDGMKKNDIQNGWLTISLSKKRLMRTEGKATAKGRTPLGEKGLGRLSTQRLASKLEVITKNEDEDFGYHVFFNWNDFTEETLLSEVKVEIEEIEKSTVKKGTRLILLDIKDPSVWKGESVEKVKGRLSQLVFPTKRRRPFDVYLNINGNPVDLDFISENVKDLAVSRYSFSFYENTVTILGQIKLQKLKGNDRPNFLHLIEADKGKGFFNFLTSPENRKKYVLPKSFSYGGEKDVFVNFKSTIRLNDLTNIIYKKAEDGTSSFLHPGNFRGKIDEYAFVEDSVDLSSIEDIFREFSRYRSYIQGQLGIRLFRDGFGIRPFGLDGEDWLKLSKEQTSGASFYGLRPGNVIGYIQIGAKTNPNLLEKTDREGIIENSFYKNFYTLNKKVIGEVNSVLEFIKRGYNDYRKKYGTQNTGLKDQQDVFTLMKKTGEAAKTLVDQVRALEAEVNTVHNAVRNEITAVKDSTFSSSQRKRLEDLFDSVEKQLSHSMTIINQLNSLLADASKLNEAVHLVEPQIQTLRDQLAEFSHLAGLGMIAEALSHEIDNVLDNLSQKNKSISNYLKEEKINDSTLYTFIEYLNGMTRSLRKQTSHLSPVLKYVRENRDTLSMESFAVEMSEFYEDRLQQNHITLAVITDENFYVTISKGKLTQIFDNIILNSEYWLKEYAGSKIHSAKITINIKTPMVRIYDNGLGINPAIEDQIFQPFVSSKPKSIGRGLGLFIIQQLLESAGCDIVLLPDKNSFGRRFIFQINFSNILK